MDIVAFRGWFDERFSILLKEKAHTFSSYSDSGAVPPIVEHTIVLAEDGKRFRPYLVAKAAKLSLEHLEDHFLLFAAVELLHVFALIHDDIMDNALVRHGALCLHKKFEPTYGPKISESVAILMGDVVFAWAYECFLSYTSAHSFYQKPLSEVFNQLVREVTHGQLLDVLTPAQPPLSKELLFQKMTLKTGRYSFVQPLRLGTILAGTYPSLDLFIEAYGVALGIAFQLQDDLLDVLPQSESGKTPFVDMEAKQQTLISWYMQHRATQKDQELFSTLFGRSLLDSEKDMLHELLVTSGAIDFVRHAASSFFDDAKKSIESFIPENDQQFWQDIVMLVAKRKK